MSSREHRAAPASPSRVGRIPFVDAARGVALIAMTIYHFTWDLAHFGWVLSETVGSWPWRVFARSIAFTFLFFAGVGLVLAHGDGVRWRAFWRRTAMVALAAAAVSVATWFFVPDGFVFFGILHAIALFSVLSLPFVFAPTWLAGALGVTVLAIGLTQTTTWTQPAALWWVGLVAQPPRSFDYVPLLPWWGATLLGVAFARIALRQGWWRAMATWRMPVDGPLRFLGRHSLAYYLAHQPILFALLFAFTALTGGPDRTEAFLRACERTCQGAQDVAFCASYCPCVAGSLKSSDLWSGFHAGSLGPAGEERVAEIVSACTADPILYPRRD